MAKNSRNIKYQVIIPILILGMASLACFSSSATPRSLPPLYPSPTGNATQTPFIILQTTTPEATQTPQVIVLVATATLPSKYVCVSANEAVYLRPVANDLSKYPIDPIPNGTKLVDTGTRNGNWFFVEYREAKQTGWINSKYLTSCP